MSKYEDELNKTYAVIGQRNEEISRLKSQIAMGTLTPREEKKVSKEIAKLEKEQKKTESLMKFAGKLNGGGAKMQQVGSSMQKAGLKTTAAVWTPAIYLGYKAAKKIKGKSPESDLVELVKECEEAHKQGKITEDEMKQYIVDFTLNEYRK